MEGHMEVHAEVVLGMFYKVIADLSPMWTFLKAYMKLKQSLM